MYDIIIALDDGHGENTAGKRTPVFPKGHKYEGQYMKENHFNKDVVARLDKHLTNCGFKTLLVAPTDEDTPLKQRTDLANNTIKNKYNRPADIYISIHANALNGVWGTHGGTETLWTKKADEPLAKIIHKHIMQGTKLRDRGVKNQNLHVCRETKMPAVIVECAFMDNLEEAILLMSDEYREECAKEIAQAVCEYFNVPFKEFVEKNEDKIVVSKVEIDVFDKKSGRKYVAEGLLVEGKTYIELRKVAESFGAQVTWDNNLKRAGIIK